MFGLTDRNWFSLAVVLYGIGAVYSVLLWRRGFRRDDWVLYGLLAAGAAAHMTAMFLRGVVVTTERRSGDGEDD